MFLLFQGDMFRLHVSFLGAHFRHEIGAVLEWFHDWKEKQASKQTNKQNHYLKSSGPCQSGT